MMSGVELVNETFPHGYPGGELVTAPPPNPTPGTGPIVELFKVKSGVIHEIEAFFSLQLPLGAEDGWGFKPWTSLDD